MAENIKLVTLNCPNCGAPIDIPENAKFGYCEFCSSQLRYDDGSREYRVVDQSEIERILIEKDNREHTEQLREERIEHQTKSRLSTQKWLIIVIVAHAIFALLVPAISMFKSVISAILVIAGWVFLPIVLAILKPRNARGGKIGMFFLFIATFAVIFYLVMLILG